MPAPTDQPPVKERPLVLKGTEPPRLAAAGKLVEIVRAVHPDPTKVVDGKPLTIRSWHGRDVMGEVLCPLGEVGTVLWVREAAWVLEQPTRVCVAAFPGQPHLDRYEDRWVEVDAHAVGGEPTTVYAADMTNPPPVPVEGQRWAPVPAGKLSRARARTFLRVDAIRVETRTAPAAYVWVVAVSKAAR